MRTEVHKVRMTVDSLAISDDETVIEKELGLIPDPLAGHLPGEISGISGNRLQLLPHVHGTDGFFLARFVKRNSQ